MIWKVAWQSVSYNDAWKVKERTLLHIWTLWMPSRSFSRFCCLDLLLGGLHFRSYSLLRREIFTFSFSLHKAVDNRMITYRFPKFFFLFSTPFDKSFLFQRMRTFFKKRSSCHRGDSRFKKNLDAHRALLHFLWWFFSFVSKHTQRHTSANWSNAVSFI